MHRLFVLAFLSLPQILYCQPAPDNASESVVLEESLLVKAALESAPNLHQIEATFQSTKLLRDSIDDQYQWQLQTDALYQKAEEKRLAQFDAVVENTKQLQTALIKPFANGVQIGVLAFANQTSNTFIQDATNTGLGLSLSLDLMRNFFGRMSAAQLRNAALLTEKAQLERDIQQKAYLQGLRKLYWSLVATEEQIKISNELLGTAKRQLADTQKRRQKNVADDGDVARSRSQVSARSATILLLEYQREAQLQQLKEQIPSLAQKEIKIAPMNLSQAVLDVLACTTVIQSRPVTPYDFTQYDEVLALLQQAYKEQQAITDSTDSWDLKLNGEARYFGKAYNYDDSINGVTDDTQRRYSVGLQLNIPLDGRKGTTEETRRILDQKRFLAEKEAINGRMEAYHTQTLTNIKLLQQAVKTQEQNTRDLSISLKSAQRKFNQARLSFRELITDQDLLLQSNLDEVRTKLTVVTTLLDYFSVFNQTPCGLNK